MSRNRISSSVAPLPGGGRPLRARGSEEILPLNHRAHAELDRLPEHEGRAVRPADRERDCSVLAMILADRLNEMSVGSESAQEEIASLRAQLAKIDASQERLVDAIEEGAEAKPLVARMKAAQRERDALAAKLEHLDGLRQSADSFDPVQWLADISDLLS
jgi:small-conductance mechanosensitive channel